MNKEKKILKNPPIVLTLCQLKHEKWNDLPVEQIGDVEIKLTDKYPIKIERFNSELNGLEEVRKHGVGKSKINITSDTRLQRIEFRSQDQKQKLIIAEDFILFSDECQYKTWEILKSSILEILSILKPIYQDINLNRLSLRYVNRFVFDEFEDPSQYFTTIISTIDGHHTVGDLYSYQFRLTTAEPNTNIRIHITHNLDFDITNKYQYILDIDVLDDSTIAFNESTIDVNLTNINNILVETFFNNITEETEDLCN